MDGWLDTDEAQLAYVDRLASKYGPGQVPWELKVRELAREAVGDSATYVGGYTFAIRRPRADNYQTIKVRLAPGIQGTLAAQLIAEIQIREQTLDYLA